MRAGSLCSGIGCAELAMPWADWRWCAENDGFASAVLAARFPHIPNLGDIGKAQWHAAAAIDLLAFGSPCQAFSIAGERGGMADDRGALTVECFSVAAHLRPRWILWENVPGILSENDGRSFGAMLWTLAQCGYGFAYRILDARHFGVPQRRRKLFLVGHLGDWRRAAAVLFERACLSGDAAPGEETQQGDAAGAGAGAGAGGRQVAAFGGGNGAGPIDIATGRNGHSGSHGRLDFGTETFVAYTAADDAIPGNGALVPGRQASRGVTEVRRLTPLECERLQGLPDYHTAIRWQGKPARDGLRYRVIGNGMAVPVVAWIGQRIRAVDALAAEAEAVAEGAAEGAA